MTKLKPNQFLLDGHIITEIPLLFQTEMVQAVAEDRKSQTRRTQGLDRFNERPDEFELNGYTDENDWTANPPLKPGFYSLFQCTNKSDIEWWIGKCPYGKPGDLLWVREAWNKYYDEDGDYIAYKADDHCSDFKWKPSIHMPKAACRIWLMVDEIRVERLQDASDDDIISEGVRIPVSNKGGANNAVIFTLGEKNTAIDFLPNGFAAEGAPKLTQHQLLFAHWAELWCKLNGRESWDTNPWVWVVKFRTLSKTGRPSDELIVKNWKEVTNG